MREGRDLSSDPETGMPRDAGMTFKERLEEHRMLNNANGRPDFNYRFRELMEVVDPWANPAPDKFGVVW